MGANYLKKYYLDDAKLAQRARLEFYRSLATRRMIAFVGSMATQAFGYGSWDQLRLSFTALALDALKEGTDNTSDSKCTDAMNQIVEFHINGIRRYWNGQVGMSLIEEVLEQYDAQSSAAPFSASPWPLDHATSRRETLRARLADAFRHPRKGWEIDRPGVVETADFSTRFDVPGVLWKLGIRRFATPSYDFELERTAMLSDRGDGAATGDTSPGWSPFDELLKLRGAKTENFNWDLGSGRIRRTFSDGWAIESDLLNRERIDRLIEFAMGTDDVDGHIMHLHGRACTPSSMIVTQRDYDNLYRRDDLNRRPFEFAKRMMMGGNPIVFVGLGMSEPELNHDLHEFISNNPFQRAAPTFLLWSARSGEGLNAQQRAAKRLDLLRRLGVLTIFDSDLVELADPVGKGDRFRRSDQEQKALDEKDPDIAAKAERVIIAGLSENKLDPEAGYLTWSTADAIWKEDLADLRRCVSNLDARTADGGASLADPTMREKVIGSRWRSMEALVGHSAPVRITSGPTTAGKRAPRPLILWDADSGVPINNAAWTSAFSKQVCKNVVCIIGSQGCGKGYAARQLAYHGHHVFPGVTLARTILVNGCFSFDTDSLLDGLARFLAKSFDFPINRSNEQPKFSRATLLGNMELAKPLKPPFRKRSLVVLNGSERFFDLGGEPLSAELDQLLASVAKAGPARTKVQWVIFGTERVRSHMEKLGAQVIDFDKICPDVHERRSRIPIPSFYLQEVWNKLSGTPSLPPSLLDAVKRYKANQTGRISGDGAELRRALYGELFDEGSLQHILGADKEKIRLAREVMKALAFIGIPVEREVLRLMPDLLDRGTIFDGVLDRLVEHRIVLVCRGYIEDEDIASCDDAGVRKTSPEDRFVLHRSLLTELRYRFGIPLSEAKLSTAFNMSLYVAQPIDGDIPDIDIHEDLGKSVDKLIGAYRYEVDSCDRQRVWSALARELGKNGHTGFTEDVFNDVLANVAEACRSSKGTSTDDKHRLELIRLCQPRQVRALRTALALVRSYYSTTGLLTLDSGDRLIREGRDGVLLEHAERLDDLIDAYGKLTLAREALRENLRDFVAEKSGIKSNQANDADRVFEAVFGGAEPFYPDELVWLHNERGVVRLAMGDLYEARRSFDQAMTVNREWVERDSRAHNWRRIRINQLSVDVEMGEISLAERKCAEIRAVSDVDDPLREDRLAVAVSDGFAGWIEHLRGRADPALLLYQSACEALSALGEVRAQAYFERLRANAIGPKRTEERRVILDRALSLAESAVQMDLVHRLRVTMADMILFSRESASTEERHRAHRYLEEAHIYSLHADVHRVRLEAAMTTARARLHMSDFEGALRFAMDAMMIATRYGMELRKIALRAILAKIMAARGHPVTAEHLARTCIKMATRLRFQTAIDKASRVIVDIPRISTAISRSDQTGRRDF